MSNFINLLFVFIFAVGFHFSHLLLNEVYKNTDLVVEEKFNLPKPEFTKLVSFGFDNLYADLLWLQLIQYYGENLDTAKASPEAFSLLDNITTLSPQFEDAYIFGGFILVDEEQFDKAVLLLKKGIENNSDKWQLPYNLGFLYYIFKKNNLQAIKYFKKSQSMKGAPSITKRLVARLADKVEDDLELKITLWQGVLEDSKSRNDIINLNKAKRKLIELKIAQDVKKINLAIKNYQAEYNRIKKLISESEKKENESNKKPKNEKNNSEKDNNNEKIVPLKELSNLDFLVKEGFIEKIPKDPFKRPYLFNPKALEVSAFPTPKL